MMKKLTLTIVVLSVAILGYGIGRAQEQIFDFDNDPDAKTFQQTERTWLMIGNRDSLHNYARAVSNLPYNKGATMQAISELLPAKDADKQELSNTILIAQNARIIELLEQLNQKTPDGKDPYTLPAR